METSKIEVTTLVDELRKMKVGEDKKFPICKLISVRSTISRLKFIYSSMRFSCKVDEEVTGEERTFTVVRVLPKNN